MRHVRPGIPGLTLPPPHGREFLKLPASRAQVADQQVQILPRGRLPVIAIARARRQNWPVLDYQRNSPATAAFMPSPDDA
jgi:hypothetical protein